MKIRLSAQTSFTRSLLSILFGLLLVGVVLKLSGYHPLEAYQALFEGATGIRSGKPIMATDRGFHVGAWEGHFSTYTFAQTLASVTPLLFAGLAIAIALRAGLFNIGAQGQMTVGATVAGVVGAIGTGGALNPVVGSLPRLIHIPLILLASALAGAIWGGIAGFLKAKRGVHEVLSTIMLNYVALNFTNYLVTHSLKDPNPTNMAVQTGLIAKSAWLTPLITNSNFTLGLAIALLCAVGVAFLLGFTALGYEIRAVGLGAVAARANGIAVPVVIIKTMAISGALAGVAGALEVMSIHHRFLQGTAGDYGFDGIAVALLGGLNAGGITLSALFFGALSNGANFMQLQTDIPKTIAVVIQAIIILFVGVRFQRKLQPPAPSRTEAGESSTKG